jgi:hypothetical protein
MPAFIEYENKKIHNNHIESDRTIEETLKGI